MTTDPIEGYLDQLLTHLRGSAQDVRRILSEVEEHLRDATAELGAAGASEEEAQRLAIERFGHPRTVARQFSARLAPIPSAAVAAELARTAVLLGTVGLVAIGASGALAELLGRLFGPAFVAGDLPGVTYTAQRCAEFLEYFPDAGSCQQAAAPTTGARWWSTGSLSEWSGRSSSAVPAGAAGRIDRTRGTWASSPTGSRPRSRPASTAWPRQPSPC